MSKQAARSYGVASRVGSLSHLARRAGWNVVDQGLSSLSNLVLSLLIARAVDSEAFGAFTVSFTVYSMALLASRALASEPMMMRFPAAEPGPFRAAARESTGTAFVLGAGLGVGILGAGLAIRGGLGTALVAMAVLMPGLLVQDAWRMVFFAERRPQLAALIDAAWTVLQVIALAVLLAIGVHSPVPFVVAWGLAAAVAAALGAQRMGAAPRLRATGGWLRAHWDITRFLLTESVLLQGAYQGALLLVGAIGSLAAIGALRGAQVILGPLSLLAASAMAFGVPEIARRTWMTERQRVLAAAALGGALSLGGVVWGTCMLLLPQSWGAGLLGDSWTGVRAVLLASVIGQVGNLISVGPGCVVYAMAKAKEGFRIHAAVAAMLVTFGLTGLVLGGANGAAWGFALAYWLPVPFWFRTVQQLGRAADASRSQPAEATVHSEAAAESAAPTTASVAEQVD